MKLHSQYSTNPLCLRVCGGKVVRKRCLTLPVPPGCTSSCVVQKETPSCPCAPRSHFINANVNLQLLN